MKIPTVKHCCCGLFDLITAGKIAGIVPIVGAVLSILLGDLGLSERECLHICILKTQ